MNKEIILEYYRQKRIKRILHFYHKIQPAIRRFASKEDKKAKIISRDASTQFLLIILVGGLLSFFARIIFATLGISQATSNLAQVFSVIFYAGLMFLSVEIADYIYYRFVDAFDIFFDYVMPIAFSVFISLGYFGIIYLKDNPAVLSKARQMHKETNLKMKQQSLEAAQKKSVQTDFAKAEPKKIKGWQLLDLGIISFTPARGENWIIATGRDGKVYPLSFLQAQEYCRRAGPGWAVVREFFVAKPSISANSDFRAWYINGESIVLTGPQMELQMESLKKEPPESRLATICTFVKDPANE